MIYAICKNFCLLLARVLFRFKAYKVERVTLSGGGILAANHSSFLDPPILGIAIKRPLYFFARSTLMKNFFMRWFFEQLNCIPVNREHLNPATFRRVTNLIKENKMMVLFPEGTRSPDGILRQGKKGTGMIIHYANTKVIPCYISGAGQALPKGAFFPRLKKIRVIYGDPIDFSQLEAAGNKRDYYSRITDKLMEAIEKLKVELEKELSK